MDALCRNKPPKAKIKTSKGKKKFCNPYADVNADADANISKWFRETVVSYLGTKTQVEKIDYEHYSQNILRLLNSIRI